MAGIITIPIAQIVNGAYAPDNSIAAPKLRAVSSGTFYNGSLLGVSGRYRFTDVPAGFYTFYDNATELTAVLGSTAEGGTYLLSDGGDLPYMIEEDGHWQADDKKIQDVGDAEESGDAVSRGFGDARYGQLADDNNWLETQTFEAVNVTGIANFNNRVQILSPEYDDSPVTLLFMSTAITDAIADFGDTIFKLADNNTVEGDNIFNGNSVFIGPTVFSIDPPLINSDPYADEHATRRSWVINQINNAAVPYQESVNVIRLMPEGTDQTNKVYNTWSKASNAARLLAGDLRRMVVEIRGTGTAGATITPSDGGISGNKPFNSYVGYKGIHKHILVTVAGTENFSPSPRSCLVSNCTIYCNDPDAEITFTGMDFDNVKFDFADSTSLTFDDCILENSIIKVATGSTTYTSSRGSGNNSNTDMGDAVGGFGGRNIDDL